MAGLTFRELLYPGAHPYSISGTGYADTIKVLTRDDLERFYRERADLYRDRIIGLPGSLAAEKLRLQTEINRLKAENASIRDIVTLERQRRELPHLAGCHAD